MKSTEKERLIKSDILSIENRVRHAFNQGYNLGYKDGLQKPETVTEFADRCRECGARYGKLLKTVNRAHWIDNNNGTISCSHCSTWFYKDGRYAYMHNCPYCNAKMAESEEVKDE